MKLSTAMPDAHLGVGRDAISVFLCHHENKQKMPRRYVNVIAEQARQVSERRRLAEKRNAVTIDEARALEMERKLLQSMKADADLAEVGSFYMITIKETCGSPSSIKSKAWRMQRMHVDAIIEPRKSTHHIDKSSSWERISHAASHIDTLNITSLHITRCVLTLILSSPS